MEFIDIENLCATALNIYSLSEQLDLAHYMNGETE